MPDAVTLSLVQSRSIPLNLHLVKVFDVAGALILQQLHFLTQVHGHDFHARRWVKLTYEQWESEIGVVKSTVIRSKFKELESIGVVVATRAYNDYRLDQRKWWTIDYDRLRSYMAVTLGPTCRVTASPPAGIRQVQVSETGNELNSLENKKSEEENILGDGSSTLAWKPPITKATSGDNMPKGPTTAMAVLNQFKADTGKAPAVKPNSTASARVIWRSIPKYHDGVKMMPVMTIAEVGRLSYIVRQYGPTSDRNLSYLIQHWVAFCKHVMAQRGIKTTPDIPTIAFLQKYVADGHNFVVQALQLTAPESATKKPAQPLKKKPATFPVSQPTGAKEKPQPTTPHEDEGDQVASLDDVLKWQKL